MGAANGAKAKRSARGVRAVRGVRGAGPPPPRQWRAAAAGGVCRPHFRDLSPAAPAPLPLPFAPRSCPVPAPFPLLPRRQPGTRLGPARPCAARGSDARYCLRGAPRPRGAHVPAGAPAGGGSGRPGLGDAPASLTRRRLC